MVSNEQVRRLLMLINEGKHQYQAADKAGMSERTARKYIKLGKYPEEIEIEVEHNWRTRQDPFDKAWQEIRQMLGINPGLEAKTIFTYLQRNNPGVYQDGQLRTLQRHIKHWRAVEGPSKEVFFPQVHRPGELSESDFTHANELGVTIRGEAFNHLLYHYVLTYSNWETAKICFSESFESLSAGYQASVWEIGGVAKKHRTDRMSAAVNKDCNPEKFTQSYTALLRHYGVTPERTNAGRGNENGDVEQRHYRLKKALEQSLMLRGSRDFGSREEYEAFIRKVLAELNANRTKLFQEELALLSRLPGRRMDDYKPVDVSVGPSSTIHVLHNTYSVHSRMIGEEVRVRIHIDHLDIWYGQRLVDRIPRLRGENKCRIQYTHIIDWLVRKPGAFENYRYKEEMFPSSNFRITYDRLKRQNPLTANKEYVKILYLAATEGESRAEAAIRQILSQGTAMSSDAVKNIIAQDSNLPVFTDVYIQDVELTAYDELLVYAGEESFCYE